MNGVTISEGTTDEWIHAANEMYKQQQYFTSLADFDVYGKACEGGYRFLVAKTDQSLHSFIFFSFFFFAFLQAVRKRI